MKYFSLLLIFFTLTLQAQKETTRVVDAGELTSIVINSDEVYRVTVKSSSVNSVTIKTKADGEYFNDIGLDLEILRHTLYLRSKYREILQSGFDKLSAHKVFAMEVELEIPQDMHIEVRSNVASVFLSGDYENVILELKSGSGFLQDFSGDAVVNTFDGNIEVETHGASVEANSRHGSISLPVSKRGTNHLKLTTINGDIMVQETK